MRLNTVHWDLDVVARASIVHREDHAGAGTDNFALFRREKVISASGEVVAVPIISGSSFRGVLRRIGEQLIAAVLDYEGLLPVPAAHLLTNGGRLGKAAKPLTDEQERQLKELVPLVAVFGGAASGRIMGGLLTVGKVLPEFAELAHLLPRPPKSTRPLLPAAMGMAPEYFSHLADHRPQPQAAPVEDRDTDTSPRGRYGVEVVPAGTRLQTWVRLENATAAQVAFVIEVLEQFCRAGHLGGRTASGYGQISAQAMVRGQLPDVGVDWASEMAGRRDEAVTALAALA